MYEQQAPAWTPTIRYVALSQYVLAVATTRYGDGWAAYVDAVPGDLHSREYQRVLDQGQKLDESVARAIFAGVPWSNLPYAR